jgi:hypothetical protein
MLFYHRFTLALLAGCLVSTTPLWAQEAAPLPERWQLTFADQSYLWDVRLVRLAGDTLVVRSRDSLIPISVVALTELRLLPETILKVGDGHRSGIGALGDNNVRVVDMAALSVAERRKTLATILSHQAAAN